VAELYFEGIVCKHLDSPYKPGVRSPHWIKTPLRRRNEFVIGGWLPGRGANRHTVGAVLVGVYNSAGRLQFCGVVSAGLGAVQALSPCGAGLVDVAARSPTLQVKCVQMSARNIAYARPSRGAGAGGTPCRALTSTYVA
jgi:hypothetical protein